MKAAAPGTLLPTCFDPSASEPLLTALHNSDADQAARLHRRAGRPGAGRPPPAPTPRLRRTLYLWVAETGPPGRPDEHLVVMRRMPRSGGCPRWPARRKGPGRRGGWERIGS
jgi:hypothetical protein